MCVYHMGVKRKSENGRLGDSDLNICPKCTTEKHIFSIITLIPSFSASKRGRRVLCHALRRGGKKTGTMLVALADFEKL